MSNDGANLGIDAGRALGVILGGDAPPVECEATRQEVRARVLAAPAPLNPPYDTWGAYARLLAEAAGYGVRSCLLVFGRSDTVAWHDAAPRALAIAQRKGRVRFRLPDGTPGGTAPAPSVALPEEQRPAAPVYRGAVRAPSGASWLVVRP